MANSLRYMQKRATLKSRQRSDTLTPMQARVSFSSPESALRLGRCAARLDVNLPAGFLALARPDQEEALELALTQALEDAKRALLVAA